MRYFSCGGARVTFCPGSVLHSLDSHVTTLMPVKMFPDPYKLGYGEELSPSPWRLMLDVVGFNRDGIMMTSDLELGTHCAGATIHGRILMAW